jgi:3-oxoacyl-[acyl-carrier protein] reductase
MNLQLDGKVALVAGSSRGLGYGVARALAREGARVHLGARDGSALEQAARELRSETGAEVFAECLDVADAGSIAQWVGQAAQTSSGLDLLVTNGGGPPAGFFESFEDAAWQSAFDQNLLGTVRLIRTALPFLRRRGAGAILTITSLAVREPSDFLVLSNVMRAGVGSLAKTLATCLARDAIRVNNLMPGRIQTARVRALDAQRAEAEGVSADEVRRAVEHAIPMGRSGTIDEFGRAAAFLLSDAASYITGASLAVDGGTLKATW